MTDPLETEDRTAAGRVVLFPDAVLAIAIGRILEIPPGPRHAGDAA